MIASPGSRFDVIVVGAGFAGLAAATALADAGKRVLVLDARPQLGGRATAFVDRATGELVDNGQHVLFGCYRETLAFLDRVGASGNVRRQRSLTVPYLDRSGHRSELKCPMLPPPLHLLAAVLLWNALPWGERLSVARMAAPLRAARRELMAAGRVTLERQMTVSAWLREHRQGQQLTDWLWEPLALAALNQSPGDAQAEPFVRVLAEMFGPDGSAAAIVLPTRPLHQVYAEPARTFIEARGGEVRTGALARIVADERSIVAVDVRGDRVPATTVISAVPWFAMRMLFAEGPPASLAPVVDRAVSMESKPIVTVNLWYDRRVMDELFVGLPGRTMQWVFDKRLAFGVEASHLSLVASGAEALTAERSADLIERARREVEDAIAGARGATFIHGTVVREKQATFSLAAGQPARPATRTALPGFFLAGDWIDTGLPGTIESAVVSGHRAASAVLEAGR
jgi:squalene-associated FAD-dependent desaturase